jgi:hypothetical protein
MANAPAAGYDVKDVFFAHCFKQLNLTGGLTPLQIAFFAPGRLQQ